MNPMKKFGLGAAMTGIGIASLVGSIHFDQVTDKAAREQGFEISHTTDSKIYHFADEKSLARPYVSGEALSQAFVNDFKYYMQVNHSHPIGMNNCNNIATAGFFGGGIAALGGMGLMYSGTRRRKEYESSLRDIRL